MKKITDLSEWHALEKHYHSISSLQIPQAFVDDSNRFAELSLTTESILLDYSKNRITKETIPLFTQLANALDLPKKIEALFSGELINTTENRAALHTALRDSERDRLLVGGINIMPGIHATLEKMKLFSEKLRRGHLLGVTKKPIQTIVNIGIGGSHLGPLMATYALSDFADDKLRCYFISHVDSTPIQSVLKQIDPETTLFIISSKSFSTLETMMNAKTIKKWMQEKLGVPNVESHFVAVTAQADRAIAFGIAPEHIFALWDWVGGRYSVWSAIGLPLAILIGMDNFLDFLKGAYAMDCHFRRTAFSKNMPVILAFLGMWYRNFFNAETYAIIPYSDTLNYFRAHLQQLDMESNGKRVTHAGEAIPYATGPIIWGEQGSLGQHAFHQLLHQGLQLIPLDFILVGQEKNALEEHHDILVASGLSQAQALMQGKTYDQAHAELLAEGFSRVEADRLAHHRFIPGNRPSNTLFINKMTPYNLGSLLALYEHKIFVQGALWNINSFDQWGVELGKQLLPTILQNVKQSSTSPVFCDSSTWHLIQHYRRLKSNE